MPDIGIGRAVAKVCFLSEGPFSPQCKQEICYYFSEDSFKALQQQKCFPLPAPINGIRLEEVPGTFDNFLVDSQDHPLETSEYNQTVTVQEGGATTTVTTPVQFDTASADRYTTIKGTIDQAQQDYFTWQTSENLFQIDANNPGPPDFTQPPLFSNQPQWMYTLKPRPYGSKPQLLTPFMRTNPPDNKNPVHWGCKSKVSMAKNQGIEITYYFCWRDPSLPKDVAKLTSRFNFVTLGTDKDGAEVKNPLEINLTTSIYMGLELGIGTDNQHFLFLFQNGQEPMFFQLTGSGQALDAVLISKFTGFNGSKLFDPNDAFFTLSVEPVMGSFIVRSNQFEKTPWIIMAPLRKPLFIGKGPIAVYGGNIQAALSFRPLQYAMAQGNGPGGKFNTPPEQLSVFGDSSPVCSTALKGNGEIQQMVGSSAGGGGGKVNMVDSEQVNGESVVTVLDAASDEAKKDVSTTRKIDVIITEVPEPDQTPAAGNKGTRTTKSFFETVSLTAGDMAQGNGYNVVGGRSPYIWMLRCELPPGEKAAPEGCLDISGDVMSVDLSWNATSYNEISHTGTLKVLNRYHPITHALRLPSGCATQNYRSFIDKTVYLTIDAGWENGIGPPVQRIFTGMTTGASIEYKAENEIITFKISDFMNVLEGSKFVLCPYYDGMRASLAVKDIVTQTGFSTKRVHTDVSQPDEDFGLPFSNPFEEPQFRFKNGSSYKEGILRIAKLDFKCIYFDQLGDFHYEAMPGGLFGSVTNSTSFYSSQGPHQDRVYNMVSISRMINDAWNVISVRSVDKFTLDRIALSIAYEDGIFNPSSTGYLGYRKHLMIDEAAIGSVEAAMRYLANYAMRVFIPPMTGRFEMYGHPTLKPLDVVMVDDNPLRMLNITTHISAAENQYWQTVEGEWFFSLENTGPQGQGSN